ncbi:lonely Cys domain-containing protein [Streptomyces zaomyceticus]|uniref:lonely Cys domain-containing protein n=1 Tax=Streptomyces zaomyceticus TaxID=68286 RepID=UPI0036971490
MDAGNGAAATIPPKIITDSAMPEAPSTPTILFHPEATDNYTSTPTARASTEVVTGLAGVLDTSLVAVSAPTADRVKDLAYLSDSDLDRLASDPVFLTALRDSLPEEEFARAVARLLVRVPEGVERPVSARNAAIEQIAGMLGATGVAESVLGAGVRVAVVPRGEAITTLSAFRDRRGRALPGETGSGRVWDHLRASSGRVTAVAEENLLGEATRIGTEGYYPDGYSTTTHELAHVLHDLALDAAEKKLIDTAFAAKRQLGGATQWPDGPRHDRTGATRDNYSSMNPKEYFAQASNAYLGTNAGIDLYTGLPRNNGADWVRAHEREILPILERLYGKSPHVAPANPVEGTAAVNDVYDGFRALWNQAEGAYTARPHSLAPQDELGTDRSATVVEHGLRPVTQSPQVAPDNLPFVGTYPPPPGSPSPHGGHSLTESLYDAGMTDLPTGQDTATGPSGVASATPGSPYRGLFEQVLPSDERTDHAYAKYERVMGVLETLLPDDRDVSVPMTWDELDAVAVRMLFLERKSGEGEAHDRLSDQYRLWTVISDVLDAELDGTPAQVQAHALISLLPTPGIAQNGVNWAGDAWQERVDTSTVSTVVRAEDGSESAEPDTTMPTLWAQAGVDVRWYRAERGGNGGVRLVTPERSLDISRHVFIELIAADRRRPAGMPVLLVLPYVGDGFEEMTRELAAKVRARVFYFGGDLAIDGGPGERRLARRVNRAGELGLWQWGMAADPEDLDSSEEDEPSPFSAAMGLLLERLLHPDSDGTSIERSVRALQVLESIRPSDPKRFVPLLLDFDELTAQVLHLPGDAAAGDGAELLDLVLAAVDAGRAGSLQDLEDFHLEQAGLYSDDLLLTGADGRVVGRNWSGGAFSEVDTGSVSTMRARAMTDDAENLEPEGPTETAPWAGEGADGVWTYSTQADRNGTVGIVLGGRSFALRREAFIRAVARDQGRSARAPVLLATPYAGAGYVLLPRALATAVKVMVWSSSGDVALRDDGLSETRTIGRPTRISHQPGKLPVGYWIATPPGLVASEEEADKGGQWLVDEEGTQHWVLDSELHTYPVVDARTHQVTGRSHFTPEDWAKREESFRYHSAAASYMLLAGTRLLVGDPQPVPWRKDGNEHPIYGLHLHGQQDGRISWEVVRPGRLVTMYGDGRGAGSYMRRRPSLSHMDREMPTGHQAQRGLFACFAASRPRSTQGLEQVPPGQLAANAAERPVFSARHQYTTRSREPFWDVLRADGSSEAVSLGAYLGPRGEQDVWEEFLPEPTGDALQALAGHMGIPARLGPERQRESALGLVRVLREVWGARAETDGELVRGIGALERLRLSDTLLALAGPFTRTFLDHVTAALLPGRDPGPHGYKEVLDQAREWADGSTADTGLTEHLHLSEVPRQEWSEEGRDRLAAQILGLPIGTHLTEFQYGQVFWALASTSTALDGLDAHGLGTLADRVLHRVKGQPLTDEVSRELRVTVAGAIAAGRSATDAAAWAAHDLVRRGVIGASTEIASDHDPLIGRNFTAVPMSFGERPDVRFLGTTEARQLFAQILVVNPHMLVAEGDENGLDLVMPAEDRTERVPAAEAAELVATDRKLALRTLDHDILLLVSGAGAGEKRLAHAIALATGRRVHAFRCKVTVLPGTRLRGPSIIVHRGDGSLVDLAGPDDIVTVDPPYMEHLRPTRLVGDVDQSATLLGGIDDIPSVPRLRPGSPLSDGAPGPSNSRHRTAAEGADPSPTRSERVESPAEPDPRIVPPPYAGRPDPPRYGVGKVPKLPKLSLRDDPKYWRWAGSYDILGELHKMQWFNYERLESLRASLGLRNPERTQSLVKWVYTLSYIPDFHDLRELAEMVGLTARDLFSLSSHVAAEPRHLLGVLFKESEDTRKWLRFVTEFRDGIQLLFALGPVPPRLLSWYFAVGNRYGLRLGDLLSLAPELAERIGVGVSSLLEGARMSILDDRVSQLVESFLSEGNVMIGLSLTTEPDGPQTANSEGRSGLNLPKKPAVDGPSAPGPSVPTSQGTTLRRTGAVRSTAANRPRRPPTSVEEVLLSPQSGEGPARDALRLLEELNAQGGVPSGPMTTTELDTLAVRVLHLPRAVTDGSGPDERAEHRELLELVMRAARAGRAGSPAELESFHLDAVVRPIAYGEGARLRGSDDRFAGRNWGEARLISVDVGVVSTVTVKRDADGLESLEGSETESAPWAGNADQRAVLYSAKTGYEGGTLLYLGGRQFRLRRAEFVDLVAGDPERSAVDAVVLAVPYAGAGYLEVPRSMAMALRAEVWSSGGDVTFVSPEADRAPHLARRSNDPGRQPVGSWTVSRPMPVASTGEAPEKAGQYLHDEEGNEHWVLDTELHTYPIVDARTHQVIGRASLAADSFARVEESTAHHSAARSYLMYDRASDKFLGDPQPLPWRRDGRNDAVWELMLHGTAAGQILWEVMREGTVVTMSGSGASAGAYMARRRSLAQMTQHASVREKPRAVLMACCAGSTPDGVQDSLNEVEPGQYAANTSGLQVFAGRWAVGATIMSSGWEVMGSSGPESVPITEFVSHPGRPGGWREFRPEPSGEYLDELTAGMGLSFEGDLADSREQTLRLVRVLRRVWGPSAETRVALVWGIGALERLRLADPVLARTGPFTMEFFDHAASRLSPGEGPDPETYATLLEHAVWWWIKRPDSGLSEHLSLPVVTEAREERSALLGESLDEQLTEPEEVADFWAMVQASVVLKTYGGSLRADLARRVLHLPERQRVDAETLLLLKVTVAQSIRARGRDFGPGAWAAQNLVSLGFMGPDTLVRGEGGAISGRDLTGSTVGSLDLSWIVLQGSPGAGDQLVKADFDNAYVVVAVGDGSGFDLTVYEGEERRDFRVPSDEAGQLIASDPSLAERVPADPILLVISGGGAGDALLAEAIATATGRTVRAFLGNVEILVLPNSTFRLKLSDPEGKRAATLDEMVTILPKLPPGMRPSVALKPVEQGRGSARTTESLPTLDIVAPASGMGLVTEEITVAPEQRVPQAQWDVSDPAVIRFGGKLYHLREPEGMGDLLMESLVLATRTTIPWEGLIGDPQLTSMIRQGSPPAEAADDLYMWAERRFGEGAEVVGGASLGAELPVTVQELEWLGVDQATITHAVLSGNSLPASEAGMSPTQQLRLLILRSGDARSGRVSWTVAELLAHQLGLRLLVFDLAVPGDHNGPVASTGPESGLPIVIVRDEGRYLAGVVVGGPVPSSW